MNTKKIFLFGFISGATISVFTLWIFGFRYPLLFTEKSKSSYSMGQQIGRNLKNQNYEISYHVLAAAVRDAHFERSRLNPQELAEGRRNLFNQSPQSAAIQRQLSLKKMGEDGFFELESGLKFKFLSESKKEVKTKKDLISFKTLSNDYKFHVTVIDQQQKKIFDSARVNKPFFFKRQRLNSDLVQILSYLKNDELVQLKLDDRHVSEFSNLLLLPFEKDHQIVLHLLKAQKK